MELEIKPLRKTELDMAVAVLVETFADDKGMMALIQKEEARYRQKLGSWFKATLKMLFKSSQPLWGVYHKEELLGLAVLSNASFKPAPFVLVQWTWAVFISCGFTTVKRTMLHDQSRQKYFTAKNQLILEFVALEPHYQGRGIGKLLLKKIQDHSLKVNKSIWLETSKPENVKIFEKSGFKLSNEYSEMGTAYYVMISG